VNWNTRLQLPRVLSLVGLALFLFAMQARADAYKGQFSLTTPTQWADVVLEPGTYEFSIPSATFPYKVFVKGNGHNVVFFSSAADLPAEERTGSMEARLKLEVISGRAVVRSLLIPKLGLALQYEVPKRIKPTNGLQAIGGGNGCSGKS
jgi:hypothetical protein